LRDHYDDGGFSGGSMDRPALQKLLAAIRERRIDVIVVYKVDRLTRSLADFAKLVELFDAHEVSFVSVTQAFNTTNSMGRLTLNVLLSFAQFEREVTGERIRDKVAASRRKGLNMGGTVPLGYDVKDKKLVINPKEAQHVRLIFQRYAELGCLTETLHDLRKREVLTRRTVRKDGSVRGGIHFGKGALHYLLRNRVYIGEVVHKGKHFPGEHEPILDRAMFDSVQQTLSAQSHARRSGRLTSAFLLTGRIFDDRGNRMSPSTAQKGGIRYRYYISRVLLEGRKDKAGSVSRVPAPEIETAVIAALREKYGEPATSGDHSAEISDAQLINDRATKIVVHPNHVDVLTRDTENARPETIEVRWSRTPSVRKREIIFPHTHAAARPIRAEPRARLIEAIAKGRRWLDELVTGKVKSTEDIAQYESYSERAVRMTLALAFLSPTIVVAAIDGALPINCGTKRLIDLSAEWHGQTTVLGTCLYDQSKRPSVSEISALSG
jgi:DNA invertase Pin-like site-specific DNA recombinase